MPSRRMAAPCDVAGYHDQLPVRPSAWSGLGMIRSSSGRRSRLSIDPLLPVPMTCWRSHTDFAGIGRAGNCTVGSTVELGVAHPSSVTPPAVGSASMLNDIGPSLRVNTCAPDWMALTPGTSLAVCTITLMGVANFTHSGSVVSKVMVFADTLARHLERA